jgi:hypothetical protein
MISIAPADIVDTIAWLADEGWSPASGQGGREEPFGDVVVEFAKGGGAIKIVRDRGIWELTLRLSSWRTWFDLGIIMDTKSGRTNWKSLLDRNPYEVTQLPEGVRWIQALPEILSWAASTPKEEVLLIECRNRRLAVQFPSLKPQS